MGLFDLFGKDYEEKVAEAKLQQQVRELQAKLTKAETEQQRLHANMDRMAGMTMESQMEQALAAFCQSLHDTEVLAVDTEFIREKSYYSKLCLIQIASDTQVACIDPLAIKNIDPLLDILYDKNKLKLLHAARQDDARYRQGYGKKPPPRRTCRRHERRQPHPGRRRRCCRQ